MLKRPSMQIQHGKAAWCCVAEVPSSVWGHICSMRASDFLRCVKNWDLFL